MSSVAAQRSRKRRGDDGHEDAPATRRRRFHGASNSASVRSFGLRAAPADSPGSPRNRCRSSRRLCPCQFFLVRSFGIRVALVTEHRLRKCRVVEFDSRRPVPTTLRRRRHRCLLPRAPRHRRNLEMGNHISQLFGKNTSDDGLEVHRGGVLVSRVESELEAEKGDVMRMEIGDGSVPAFDRSELFEPLTDEDEIEVNAVLRDRSHRDRIIVKHESSNIEISKKKFQCLRPHGLLNDEVVNLYIELLKEREKREPRRFLKCHIFNTFFYKKLTCGTTGYDYQSIKRWTTYKKLGYELIHCEKIFVPVHRELHWSLAIINMKNQTFQYLDSLGGMGHDVLRVLARYIMDEVNDKSKTEINTSSWVEVSDSVPLQQNGWDCGMFMLKFIDFHSRGLEPSFSPEHMAYFRKRTAKEIMRLRAD